MRYWSWPAVIGLLVSAATAVSVLLSAAVIALALCVRAWTSRLYAGQDWGTAYSWTSVPAQR